MHLVLDDLGDGVQAGVGVLFMELELLVLEFLDLLLDFLDSLERGTSFFCWVA